MKKIIQWLKSQKKAIKWLKAAGIRAVKTFAQTAASLITVGALISEVNWTMVLSASAVAFIYSILTSFAGLPEIKE
ncbi:MAG: hypothetical protein J6A78_05235 [Clostridia bacterium]|nr:hypothetical protein [Oscillospiraceae bacterium]MBO5358704.1 hypothetical protein [Clostridia bacterium]